MSYINNRSDLIGVYEATMCSNAGCCGDIDGALDAAKEIALSAFDDYLNGLIDRAEARRAIEEI